MGGAPWQRPWVLARPPSPILSCPEPAFPAQRHCQGSDWWGLFSNPGAWVGRVKTEKLVAIPSPPSPRGALGPLPAEIQKPGPSSQKRHRRQDSSSRAFWTKLRWKPGRAWRGVLKSDALGGQQTVPEVLQAQGRAGLLPRGEQSNGRVGRRIPDCLVGGRSQTRICRVSPTKLGCRGKIPGPSLMGDREVISGNTKYEIRNTGW